MLSINNYKEVFLTYDKKNKYQILHPDDIHILTEFVEPDKFLEQVNRLPTENKSWAEWYKWSKRTERAALVFAIYLFVVLLYCIVLCFLPFDHFLFLIGYQIWIITWVMFASFMILWNYIDGKKITPLHEKIASEFSIMVEDEFSGVNWTINFMRRCSLVFRPVGYDVKQVGIDQMDYYDFINYNTPDDDEFYNIYKKGDKDSSGTALGNNCPSDCDPYQRNFKQEYLVQRSKMAAINKGGEFSKAGTKFKVAN